jgi:hypothetical protein
VTTFTPPRVVITIPLEGAPVVRIQCDHRDDEQRIRYWLTTQPELEDIVDRALQLDRRRAA